MSDLPESKKMAPIILPINDLFSPDDSEEEVDFFGHFFVRSTLVDGQKTFTGGCFIKDSVDAISLIKNIATGLKIHLEGTYSHLEEEELEAKRKEWNQLLLETFEMETKIEMVDPHIPYNELN